MVNKVIVTVSGGVVQHVAVPAGVLVEVHDYDVEETDFDPDYMTRDAEGAPYALGVWPRGVEVSDAS